MATNYQYIHSIALLISFYSTCFSMEQETIYLPKEMHIKIYRSINDIKALERLRITCKDWKKASDELTAHSGLLRLLRSLPNANKETKTRILFYAIYNKDYHLTKRILKSTPNEQLYLKFNSNLNAFDPYHVAQNKSEKILDLLKKYNYDTINYGVNQCNVKIKCFDWPKDPTLEKLLIASISGNNISFENILRTNFNGDNVSFENMLHTYFNQKNIPNEIGKLDLNLFKNRIALDSCFYIITKNDDELCIIPCIQWIKNNPAFKLLIRLLLKQAIQEKSLKVFTKLLETQDDINAIETCYSNGNIIETTLKDGLLSKHTDDNIPQEYYDAAEIILNTFGAKTAQELKKEKL